jgi:hypothetical protein
MLMPRVAVLVLRHSCTGQSGQQDTWGGSDEFAAQWNCSAPVDPGNARRGRHVSEALNFCWLTIHKLARRVVARVCVVRAAPSMSSPLRVYCRTLRGSPTHPLELEQCLEFSPANSLREGPVECWEWAKKRSGCWVFLGRLPTLGLTALELNPTAGEPLCSGFVPATCVGVVHPRSRSSRTRETWGRNSLICPRAWT